MGQVVRIHGASDRMSVQLGVIKGLHVPRAACFTRCMVACMCGTLCLLVESTLITIICICACPKHSNLLQLDMDYITNLAKGSMGVVHLIL